jgi:hypothetical protein
MTSIQNLDYSLWYSGHGAHSIIGSHFVRKCNVLVIYVWNLSIHCNPFDLFNNTVMIRYPDKFGFQTVHFTYNRTRYSYLISKSGYRTL